MSPLSRASPSPWPRAPGWEWQWGCGEWTCGHGRGGTGWGELREWLWHRRSPCVRESWRDIPARHRCSPGAPSPLLFYTAAWLTGNVVLALDVQQSDSVIHMHVSILYQILFPIRLLQSSEQSSLDYRVWGLCLLLPHLILSSVIWTSNSIWLSPLSRRENGGSTMSRVLPKFQRPVKLCWDVEPSHCPDCLLSPSCGLTAWVWLASFVTPRERSQFTDPEWPSNWPSGPLAHCFCSSSLKKWDRRQTPVCSSCLIHSGPRCPLRKTFTVPNYNTTQ